MDQTSCAPEIPAHYLLAASRLLGPAGRGTRQTVVIEALPFWGRFEVTFEPVRTGNGKWAWQDTGRRLLEAPARPYLTGLVRAFSNARPATDD